MEKSLILIHQGIKKGIWKESIFCSKKPNLLSTLLALKLVFSKFLLLATNVKSFDQKGFEKLDFHEITG